MKQLTNDIYRTKKKLELLESEGIGQLLVDFYNKIFIYPEQYVKDNTRSIMEILKEDYLKIMQDYKPSKQTKIQFNEI